MVSLKNSPLLFAHVGDDKDLEILLINLNPLNAYESITYWHGIIGRILLQMKMTFEYPQNIKHLTSREACIIRFCVMYKLNNTMRQSARAPDSIASPGSLHRLKVSKMVVISFLTKASQSNPYQLKEIGPIYTPTIECSKFVKGRQPTIKTITGRMALQINISICRECILYRGWLPVGL
jgi:hypothetical protein